MIDRENLTAGSVSKELIVFALSLLLVNLLQSSYSIVDTLVVGRIVKKAGLTAISNASMVSFIISSIYIGVTMGGTVLIAQLKGADDVKGQSETVGTLFSLTLTVSDVVTAAALLGYKPLFGLLDIPSDAMGDACEYMEVICRGTVLVFGYSGVCSIMKGFEDSKSLLYFVRIAAVVNIALDLLLVGSFGTGAKGAAYATISSQSISLAAAMIHLKHGSFIFSFKPEHFVVKKDKLTIILKAGLPTAAQVVVVNISYLLITGAFNQFGTAVTAVFSVGSKVNTSAGMLCWAVGQTVTTMTRQNMGADNREWVKEAINTGLYLNLTATAVAVLLVQIFAGPIIRLFDPVSSEVTWGGTLYLRICYGPNNLICGAVYTFDSFAIGVSSANVAMVNALLDTVVARLPTSWLLTFPLSFGFPGVYLEQVPSPTLPAATGELHFKNRIWERGNLIRK